MKNKIVLLTLLVMLVGTNSFVYANEGIVKRVQNENQQESQKRQESLAELYHKAGLDKPEVIIHALADLGISDQDLQEAIKQGKKIYEVLQEREITLEAFKNALSKEYTARIKQATKDKVITKKEAKTLIKLLDERMNAWEV